MATGIIRFADFELDRAACQPRHRGRTIPIERLPLELLFLLAERSGQLVTRDEIYQRIWKSVFVDPDNAINAAIRKVRRALNDDARRPQFVIRVCGRGYRFDDGVLRANLGPTSITSSTRFVGRASEMSCLRAALADMMSGRGRLALISGEPGIGKSRICAELATEAEKNCVATLIGHCIEQEGVPYLPFVEILESYVERTQSPEELGRVIGEEGPELARLLPKLRRILPDLPPPHQLGREQSRRHLFNTFCDFIARRCREQPTLLVVEDLQWAQDSTLALMSHLSQRDPSLPLMVVGTYRASRADLNQGLTRTLESLVRGRQAIQIRLQGLNSGEVALMLQGLSGQAAPDEVTREFSERTDGNPFFVEELFRHLAEENRLYDAAGQLKGELKIGEIEVPPNVGLVVGRRMGRLCGTTNEILAVAAVIGRSFNWELLEAASGAPTELLLDCLDEAEQVGLVRSTSDYPQPRTEFCHELTREVVLNQLSCQRRKRLHLKVAEAIERIYADSLEEHYGALAQHYSSDTRKSARYLFLAGQQAMQRSAHVAAVRLLTASLDLLESLPQTNERDRMELASRIVLGVSLSAAKGLAAPEVEHSYNRAVQLSSALGNTEDLFWAQCLLAKSYFMRASMQDSQHLAKKLVDLAAASGNPSQLFLAHYLMGQSSFWLGQLALGLSHLEQAIALSDPQVDRATTSIFDCHLIIPCYGYAAKALWFMGYPHRALHNTLRAESVAKGFGDPGSQLAAMTVPAWFHVFRCEPAIVLKRAEGAMTFAHEHGFPYHAAQSAIMKGWALAHLGHESDAVAQIEAGLAARKATGAEYPPAQFLGWLAEAYGKAGQECKGLRVLEGALATIHWAGDLLFEPELHRLKGELLLMQDSSNWEAAARCCQIAIEMSSRLGAKSLELRARTSLARLLAKRRHSQEARATLTEIYGWFTEGFDTLDLKDAKVLLDEVTA